ncbi:unnamed protein product [Rotaria magnacalcarata]|uniref:STAS domain-containing protein n=2 Tax=Rotaria magnacalcarata TaxID=392030 RepID=A0A816ZHM1_9BILA|nr:unnamed protein product [Rotaria magnacalcarata]CAF3789388.1 unnamed protein product [Rotaria magnacalcarata]
MLGLPDEQNENSDIITSNNSHNINIDGQFTAEKSFDHVFFPTAYEDRTSSLLFRQICSYVQNKCLPSKKCGISYIKLLFPFLSWLKAYKLTWLPNDIVCGITVAIMQIPQGMGYALLANLPAITGLYVSFFSSLIYALFGTSRHLSMGAIAVISLMTGNVVNRLTVKETLTTMVPSLLNKSTIESASNGAIIDPSYAITIATTLAFTVGIVQLLLSIFHLGFVTSFLSDTFVSGYTCGTAILVFTSQVPDIFGLSLKRYVGPFNVIYTYIEIFSNLKKTNIITLLVSACSIIALVLAKEYLDPFYKKKIKKFKLFKNVQIPIPMELIIIIIGTIVSYLLDLNGNYKVKIVNTIGRGFRKPQGPSVTLMPTLMKDAVIIAIVTFAICMSLAKTYAKKFKYIVNSNQELTAYGACNIIGSFFASFPSAASLSRTSVYVNAGGRTQMASLVACSFLLIIILRIGSLFESLPKACLASIIVVALKGLLLQMKDFYTIGRVTKLEAVVWLMTFLSTVILDVDYGLFVGIIVSLFVVILRQFRPRTTILGQYDRSNAYKKARRFSNAFEIPHVKIFRFESAIIYFNADFFRESLLDSIGIDLKTGQQRKNNPQESNDMCISFRSITHIIIDCSSINQIDYSGGKIFIQALKELNGCQYKVYLCQLRYYNYDVLQKLQMDKECSVIVTATLHDAVHDIQDDLRENHNNKLLLANTEL